ncbi:hypothetical protein [Flavobacterium sp. SM15]|nr:hypothetical protein [Flavobacterium sp. SM15]
MRKLVAVSAIALSLASCSSGWSCKARYVKHNSTKNKETHRVA